MSLCFRITKSAVIVAVVVGSVSLASAQTTSAPPHVSLQKTIGQAKPEVVPSLIAMNSKGASLRDGKLVLVGILQTRSFSRTDPYAPPATTLLRMLSTIGRKAQTTSPKIRPTRLFRASQKTSRV